FGRVGAACAAPLVATLLMATLGLSWRTSLCAIAAPGALLALAFWLAVRNTPGEHPWANRAEQEEIEAVPLPAGKGVTLLLNRHSLLTLGVLMACSCVSTFQDQLY